MNEPYDEQYFVWLYSRIGSVEATHPRRTYWNLMRHLYIKEFIWLIPNDDNRVEDGRDLRLRFLEENNIHSPDVGWMGLGCSMLEMLIGVANRLAFETSIEPRKWFWELMENLGLDAYTDNHKDATAEIDEVCDRVIFRTYNPDGEGGLFPLREPREDQRDVEIWYQLSSYLAERF